MKYFFNLLIFLYSSMLSASTDQLPSWVDGEVKKSIVTFVTNVTDKNNKQYVEPEDRIATFDNDGTLWNEVPTVEVEFIKMKVKEDIAKDPTLKNKEPYRTLLTKGKAGLTQESILQIMAKSLSGTSEEEFTKQVEAFFSNAKHPVLKVPYTKTAYKPMLELLSYLRENNFKIFITSGGDVSFMRVVAPEIYGVPAENIIGSSFKGKVVEKDGEMVLMRTDELEMMNDKDKKPVGIQNHIGKRPILSVGNVKSGGDVEHLRYSSEGDGPSLQLMINHDDAAREAAYTEKDGRSLTATKKYNWKLISIKNDWNTVYQ